MVQLPHVERRWIDTFSPNLGNATPGVLKNPHEPGNFLASKHYSCMTTQSREVLRHWAAEIAEVSGSITNLKFQVLVDLIERRQLPIAHSLHCG